MKLSPPGRKPASAWVRLSVTLPLLALLGACSFPTRGSPGFFEVTVDEDADDRNPGDGLCRSTLPSGACTLRAAVAESNALPGENTVALGAADYTLRLSAHLLVADDLRIAGAGRSSTAISRTAGSGRLFAIESANVWISDVTMSGGNDVPNGGAIVIRAGSFVSLERVQISGSEAYTAAGGIDVHDSRLTMVDSEVTQNRATGAFGGGLRVNEGATAVIDRSTFAANSSNRCGAIYNFGTLALTNSTISGNSATTTGRGTGGLINVGNAHLNNVTVYRNDSGAFSGDADSSGGLLTVGPTARTTMSNTILAGNTQGSAANDCRGTIVSYGYNLVQETGGCTLTEVTAGNIHGRDPELLPLRISSGSVTRVHRPSAGSPVVGAGHPQVGSGVSVVGRCEARDQAGRVRQLTGSGERCDIGSIEY